MSKILVRTQNIIINRCPELDKDNIIAVANIGRKVHQKSSIFFINATPGKRPQSLLAFGGTPSCLLHMAWHIDAKYSKKTVSNIFSPHYSLGSLGHSSCNNKSFRIHDCEHFCYGTRTRNRRDHVGEQFRQPQLSYLVSPVARPSIHSLHHTYTQSFVTIGSNALNLRLRKAF